MNHLFIEFTVRTTLIAACTGIILRAARIRRASAQHKIWTSVMLLMLLLPLWIMWGPKAHIPVTPFRSISGVRIPQSSAETLAVTSLPAVGQGSAESVLPHEVWNPTQLALSVYVIGVFALLMRLVAGTIYAHGLIRRAVSAEGRLTNPSCAVPVTLGPVHPVTLLPQSWREWSSQQLDAVLMHEREHVRRRDPLVQWLALFNRAVFWFHPLAWWLERHLSLLAEQACDDAVLARGHDPHDYTEYLLAIERTVMRSGRRLKLIGVAMSGSFLPKRIQRILEGLVLPQLSARQMTCAAVGCAISCGLLAGATLEVKTAAQERLAPKPLVEYSSQAGTVSAASAEPFHRPEPIYATPPKVSTVPTPARLQGVPPKWAGTWTLNKARSNFGQNTEVSAMRDSIESMTVKLDAASEGLAITTDVSLIRPVLKQHAEFALKFGVSANLTEVNPLIAMAYPGTLTIVPVADNALNLGITYADGSGSSVIRFEVSADGNTLTESLLPEDLRMVFDRQF